MTAAELANFSALSDAEVTALAYREAASGDAGRALLWAVEELISLETRLDEAQRLVSQGYVRAGAMREA